MPLQNSVALRHVITAMDDLTSCRYVDEALKISSINRKIIAGPSVFLPLHNTVIFAEELARRTGEKHIGALLGRHCEYTGLSWYSDFVLSAPDLGQALRRAAVALPTLHPGCSVSLDTRDGHLLLLFDSKIQNVVGARHFDEFMPMLMIDLCKRFLGPYWLPSWAEVTKSSNTRRADLEAIYGVPVTFRSRATGISIKLEELAVPNPRRPSSKKQVLLRDLPGLMGVSPPQSFRDLVVEVLRVQVTHGDISVETVAAQLAIGVQSMQRRLRTEGTSFREVRAEFLKARAKDLILQTDHSIRQIARALGYEETNSFRRAFWNWTGLTPTEFRRRLR